MKKQPSKDLTINGRRIIIDNALVPQGQGMTFMKEQADRATIKKLDRKLRGFKYGVGVGH